MKTIFFLLLFSPTFTLAQPTFHGLKSGEVKDSMLKLIEEQGIKWEKNLHVDGSWYVDSAKTIEALEPTVEFYDDKDLEGNDVLHFLNYTNINLYGISGDLRLGFRRNQLWQNADFTASLALKDDFTRIRDNIMKMYGKGKTKVWGDNGLSVEWRKKDFLILLELKEGNLDLLYGETKK